MTETTSAPHRASGPQGAPNPRVRRRISPCPRAPAPARPARSTTVATAAGAAAARKIAAGGVRGHGDRTRSSATPAPPLVVFRSIKKSAERGARAFRITSVANLPAAPRPITSVANLPAAPRPYHSRAPGARARPGPSATGPTPRPALSACQAPARPLPGARRALAKPLSGACRAPAERLPDACRAAAGRLPDACRTPAGPTRATRDVRRPKPRRRTRASARSALGARTPAGIDEGRTRRTVGSDSATRACGVHRASPTLVRPERKRRSSDTELSEVRPVTSALTGLRCARRGPRRGRRPVGTTR